MVVYEVAMTVDQAVFDGYVEWLTSEHIPEVISHPGFVKAELLLEPSGRERCRVLYYVQTEAALDSYLEKHATALRGKSAERWGTQVSAERSIWALYGTLSSEKSRSRSSL